MPRLGTRLLFIAPVIVGHVLFPLSLLLHLGSAATEDRMTWLAALYVAGSYFAFLYLAGSWSWFGGAIRHVLPALLLVTVWWTYLHGNTDTILDFRLSLDFILSIVMGTLFAALAIYSVRGRQAPRRGLELQFPLRGGVFHVVQGGASRLLNHHYMVPAQRYALDIVKVGGGGTRAKGLYPASPDRYTTWGTEVVSPCEARVASVVDGLPDLYPLVRDPEHPAGNHVVLEHDGATVYLAHLKQGSIIVRAGERVRAGQLLARAGNSGHTTEPHLHMHAELGTYSERDPKKSALPIRFDGRFLVRNDVVRIRVGVAVTTPEAEAERGRTPDIPVVGDSV